MTLPNNSKKLGKAEIESITNAISEAGIQQIHPDKMEAYAEELVSRYRMRPLDEVAQHP
jgi:hypothetical protein